MSKDVIENITVERWTDSSGRSFVSLKIEGVDVEKGEYGLSDAYQTLSPVNAIAIGTALRKAGLKGLKR